LLALGFGLITACQNDSPDRKASSASGVSPQAKASTARNTASGAPADRLCQDLRARSVEARPQIAESIKLHPPTAEKKIVLAKTGVIVRFSRDDFLTAAGCLELKQAVQYIEKETGFERESPLRDAFQLSYVAAALLDVGRADVRLKQETAPRPSIVREAWSADGCAGACRSYGRVYRLREADPSFFFRVTDKTENTAD
jgi:hypothetical protein